MRAARRSTPGVGMSIAERVRARTPVRRWVGLGAAAGVWFALYALNGRFWTWLVGDVVGLDLTSRLGSGVLFFVVDSVKIVLLLVGIIFVVTVLRSFMSVERTRALLGGKPGGRRQRDGRGPGRGHPVLLLLGRAGVHRLRRGRGPAGCDLVVPHRFPVGERGGDRAAVRPVRYRPHCAVHRRRLGHRHRGRVHPRGGSSSSAGSSRSCSRPGSAVKWSTPRPD